LARFPPLFLSHPSLLTDGSFPYVFIIVDKVLLFSPFLFFGCCLEILDEDVSLLLLTLLNDMPSLIFLPPRGGDLKNNPVYEPFHTDTRRGAPFNPSEKDRRGSSQPLSRLPLRTLFEVFTTLRDYEETPFTPSRMFLVHSHTSSWIFACLLLSFSSNHSYRVPISRSRFIVGPLLQGSISVLPGALPLEGAPVLPCLLERAGF